MRQIRDPAPDPNYTCPPPPPPAPNEPVTTNSHTPAAWKNLRVEIDAKAFSEAIDAVECAANALKTFRGEIEREIRINEAEQATKRKRKTETAIEIAMEIALWVPLGICVLWGAISVISRLIVG